MTATAEKRSLDEVLVAMDVVDTLRHRDIILQKEMDQEGREQQLIARLRDIYPPQNPLLPDASMPGTAPRITPDMLTARTLEGIRTVNSFDLKLHDRLTAHRDLSRAAA